jgi:hypothetical protein
MPFANLIAPALKADRLHLISAADTPWAHTHHDPKKVTVCPMITLDSFCFEGPADNHRQNGKTTIYHTSAHTNNVQHRFWIFNTGHRLIRNHGDVWNKRVFNMVMALLEKRLAERQVLPS